VRTLRATASHLYPGAPLRTADALPGEGETAECLVDFADGTCARGRLAGAPGGLVLALAAHRTARGTDIPAKRWRLAEAGSNAGEALLKVRQRLPDQSADRGPT
jgi:hypothetical protein